MKEVYLLLGSNEGSRELNMSNAAKLIEQRCGKIVRLSSIYETEAWGIKEQSAFMNRAILIQTLLTAPQLLTELKAIEKEVGRKETVKWGPRVIDIDILFYGSEIIDLPELKIPHPYLHERKFTLVPLNEIADELVHPVINKTVELLLSECRDESKVTLSYSSNSFIS